MELCRIDPNKYLHNDEILNISKGVIYHVSTGRNAWHSTWVSHYTKSCMHTTLKSAQEHAETHRVSGTVFSIEQLPCLVFRSRKQVLLVSEINSKNPLSGYSSDAISNIPESNAIKINGAKDNYIAIGAPLLGAGLSFLSSSRFWRTKQTHKDAVMLLSHSNRNIAVEKCGNNALETYASYSHGSNYLLGWKSTESKISSSSVINIINSHKAILRSNDIANNLNPPAEQGANKASQNIKKADVRLLCNSEKPQINNAFVRLRIQCVSHGDKSSPAVRDNLINNYLDELSEVVTCKVIDRMSDEILHFHHLCWCKAIIAGADINERIDWMADCVSLSVSDLKFEA